MNEGIDKSGERNESNVLCVSVLGEGKVCVLNDRLFQSDYSELTRGAMKIVWRTNEAESCVLFPFQGKGNGGSNECREPDVLQSQGFCSAFDLLLILLFL